MDYIFNRKYTGPVKMVIFDWSGTIIDYGCYAPAVSFVKAFKQRGIDITMEQARGPMGLKKIDHIRTILQQDELTSLWKKVHNKMWTEADVQNIYEKDFLPTLLDCVGDYTDLIPGTLETVDMLKSREIKIGSSTGYSTKIMEINLRQAKKQGFNPDTNFCASDVPAGRPEPWMIFSNMQQARIFPPQAVVKVDDTKPGIIAGLNAGTWTVGLSKTGNEVGLNLKELNALPADEIKRKVEKAADGLIKAGAHYVVESIADIPAVISEIEQRLKTGHNP
ncbi:MAG: phosphonoacetaldehyde hydrolase [Sedimentisphaerales bacterium]|nr:phosphonoacetaldehyde hydrolase [Sedimentisphaerales bacterium]